VEREKKALSSRIIPKGTLIGLRRAEFGDLSEPETRTQVVPARAELPAAPSPSLLLLGAKEEGYREGLEEGQRRAEGGLEAERTALRALGNGLAELVRDFSSGSPTKFCP
jgi:hypothetical protein